MKTKMRYIMLCLIFASVFLAACQSQKGDGTKKRTIVTPSVTQGEEKNAPQASVSEADTASRTAVQAEVLKSRREKSRMYAGFLVDGNEAEVWQNFNAKLSKELSKEQLAATWKETADGLEGYLGLGEVKEVKKGSYYIDTVIVNYENSQARSVQFVYDSGDKIAGIWFNTAKSTEVVSEEESSQYKEKDYSVNSEAGTLSGILTLPQGTDKPPVVLLLCNEDCDRDGSMGQQENKPLQDLARGLAAQGIASLRYDQRSYAYSDKIRAKDGMWQRVLMDASQAVNQLYTESKIDKKQIFVLTMGESTKEAAALVKAKQKRLKGVILVAPAATYEAEKDYGTGKVCVSDMAYFMKKNSTIPLLVLQGGRDFETDEKDTEALKKMWKGRSHILYHEYKELNHYMMPASGKVSDATQYDAASRVSGQVTDDIATWIDGLN